MIALNPGREPRSQNVPAAVHALEASPSGSVQLVSVEAGAAGLDRVSRRRAPGACDAPGAQARSRQPPGSSGSSPLRPWHRGFIVAR